MLQHFQLQVIDPNAQNCKLPQTAFFTDHSPGGGWEDLGYTGRCSIHTTAPEVYVRIWATGRVFYTDHSSRGGCEDLGYRAGVLY